MAVTHKKAAQILKNWSLEDETITDAYHEGTGNKNESACYVGTQFVLKYTANLGKLKNHIEVSKAIASAGLMAATPILTTDGREYIQIGEVYYYLTKRLEGEQLLAGSYYDANGVDNGRFLGEIIGQLHLALDKIQICVTDADLLATIRDWALPKAKQVLGISDDFSKNFLDALTALYPNLPRQIIHRDPNPGNIIKNDTHWGFIDFDLAERNARIYDPCYAATAVLSESFGKSDEHWITIYRNIICGYDSVVHLTDEERRAIPYVLLSNQFVCVAWFADQPKYAEIFEVNKKMTLWLIDKFAELKDITSAMDRN